MCKDGGILVFVYIINGIKVCGIVLEAEWNERLRGI